MSQQQCSWYSLKGARKLFLPLFRSPGVGVGGWIGVAVCVCVCVCVCVKPGSLSCDSASITWFSTRVWHCAQHGHSLFYCMCAKLLQLCPTPCDPMDCSPPGSSVHGILQAKILEWVAIAFSRGSSWPRDRTQVSHIAGIFFTIWATCHSVLLGFVKSVIFSITDLLPLQRKSWWLVEW